MQFSGSCFVPSVYPTVSENRGCLLRRSRTASCSTRPGFSSRPNHAFIPAYRVHPTPQRAECKLLPVRMADDSTGPVIRIIAAALIAGLILASFLPVLDVLRNSSPDNAEALIDTQLSKVPVFTVTDSTGRPFLSETDDHRLRIGYFFVQPADAEKYLQRVKADNSDAKVLAIGLNRAVKVLDSRPTAAKSIPEKFQLFPDDEQAAVAEELTDGAFAKTFGKDGVPIFYLDGLAVQDEKRGTAVYPLFFEKAKLDEALSNLKKRDPKSTLDAKDTQIIDLKQTIKEIRGGANPRLNQVVFVPLTDSLEMLKKLNAEKAPTSE